ncbi:tRNA lysidine(34) synthetase TilS [Desemzia sp. RIT804]|uniref:tRNA lysidine(34) synthetase TilS n=1 Tax=Desemzia sp. RIT 804 TaxID=2810209 RepID=UPI001950CA24|nr:tRNA lysidine(34) synthetase TilS [Desemzia sp. RIT 804]MBM6615215.1 tRNA lysidine(34) synthetase TilS [Desemzia sp. RIT 804]
MDLFVDFLKQCQKQLDWKKSSRVLVAVSGGVDSMVLLDLMQRLPNEWKPWFGVVHVNHQLREASIHEAKFLEQFCRQAKIPFFMTKWEKNQQPTANVEEAARKFRYTFFKDIFTEQQATHLLTAHHGDDQIETILMRMVRGASLESMAGIKAARPFLEGMLVRPLLAYTKEQLYQYSEERQLHYFEDETNQSLAYTRNRYRNQVIPLLKEENPQLVPHFANFSSDLQDVLAVAQAEVERQLEHISKKAANGKQELDRKAYLDLDKRMQRLVLQVLLMKVYQNEDQPFQRQHIQDIHDLLSSEHPNRQIDLPGNWLAKRRYDTLIVCPAEKNHFPVEIARKLHLGEWVNLPQGGKIGLFTADTFLESNGRKIIWLDATSVRLPLLIRQREPGDRMSLKGSGGTKKIKDILIDQKVPLEQRDELRVVCDATGDVICFLGYKDSRLSIERETDTIQYILIHDQNGDES